LPIITLFEEAMAVKTQSSIIESHIYCPLFALLGVEVIAGDDKTRIKPMKKLKI